MVALSEEEKHALKSATAETARVLVEDLEYIREVVAKPGPIPRDIRHLSNLLRRLLIDNGGDLRKVSPPRLDRRLHLSSPDMTALYKRARKEPWPFLSAGKADIFGITIDAWAANPTPKQTEGYEPGKIIQLPLDNFVGQKVICFESEWVTRGDAIKYIANVAHGVHSGNPKEPKHELLKRIRYVATIKFDGPPGPNPPANGAFQMPMLTFNPAAIAKDDKPLAIDRNALDFVLVQLLSTAQYLTNSPDVQELEAIIKKE
jgi:hypothetical protein